MTLDLGIATAQEIAPGLFQAECPTTHTLYLSMTGRRMSVGVRPVVWLCCACCDAGLHTFDDCDPLLPQSHLYWLNCNA